MNSFQMPFLWECLKLWQNENLHVVKHGMGNYKKNSVSGVVSFEHSIVTIFHESQK